jgi:hypothetical protein
MFTDEYPVVDFSKRTTANGYVVVSVPMHPRADKKGYFYLHIILAELKYGRFVAKRERVHHKDHDKTNNTPDNVIILSSNSEHCKLHAEERGPAVSINLICPQCKDAFSLPERMVKSRSKNNKAIFCSKPCSARYYSITTPVRKAVVVHGTSNAYGYHKCRCSICREGTRTRQRDYLSRVSPRFPKAVKG